MKILKTSLLVSILVMSKIDLASARTKGLYLEASAINTSVRYKHDYDNKVKSVDNNTSFGFKLSYALNYKNLYLAPGIFFDNYEVNMNAPTSYKYPGSKANQNLHLINGYGAKLNMGYDASPRFSTFLILGYGSSRYSTATYYEHFPEFNRKTNANLDTYIGGLGIKYSLLKNVDIIATYEVGTLSATSGDPNKDRYKKSFDDIVRGDADAFPPDLRISRLAFSYRF